MRLQSWCLIVSHMILGLCHLKHVLQLPETKTVYSIHSYYQTIVEDVVVAEPAVITPKDEPKPEVKNAKGKKSRK